MAKEAKGKKPKKNKPTSKKYKMYKIEGDKVTRERSCPRCGQGVFLMKAKDRLYCGRCHYTEFLRKEVSEKKEEKSEEKPESKPEEKPESKPEVKE